ncbi:MAG: branched-chain amino acid ABC transporter permease [Oscillospiraceae bacterium]|nr:branched-chain amino acid ABC transporter permease [Oscillospiraceae bacterium]
MLQQKTSGKANIIFVIALLAVILTLEQALPSSSMLFTVLKKSAIYALAAVSMNLLNGFTGLFSLGQAGFMLIGAYVYGMLNIAVADRAAVYQYFDGGIIQFSLVEGITAALGPVAGLILGVLLGLLAAGLAAAVFAWLIGLPALRFRSDYLAIATLGFAEIIRAVFQWDGLGPLTNGSNLLRKFTNFDNFNIRSGGKVAVNLSTTVTVLIAALCILLIILVINSTYGRAFKAIRDDEIAAEAMGINLARHKMLSFVISAFFAGIAGGMLAMYQTTVQALAFKTAMTYEILLIVVIGGIGSVTGSCISAFIFIGASEWWLRFLDMETSNFIPGLNIMRPGFRKVVFSVAIMIIVLFFRKGIMGERELNIQGAGRRLKQKLGGKPPAAKEAE